MVLTNEDPVISTHSSAHVPFESLKGARDRLPARSKLTDEQIKREEAALKHEADNIMCHSYKACIFEAVRKA